MVDKSNRKDKNFKDQTQNFLKQYINYFVRNGALDFLTNRKNYYTLDIRSSCNVVADQILVDWRIYYFHLSNKDFMASLYIEFDCFALVESYDRSSLITVGGV
ncbi:hypothetical protein PPL_09074 [Heterostelium album PN500]|uniref:Uncharacterized protein n=1 Tax=Heterostelium pallidum (strain ATCC 26659 / Pp 5 / PN500) TaxID=670386 RepID=D3BKJ3_HETP5|nr:hypothetical protein PPL_09074 [Heterostelium album PN500]EFA78423.1 hypothetical protein PPL_09074 [Heterostelium album PN500]|eukprot:XP_020430548.1 hypothetical protein PPL_09074 [Heterostelium album PN500]